MVRFFGRGLETVAGLRVRVDLGAGLFSNI